MDKEKMNKILNTEGDKFVGVMNTKGFLSIKSMTRLCESVLTRHSYNRCQIYTDEFTYL